MFKTIADPADCEVCSVIRFLNAKNFQPAEIHHLLVEIYGENVMTGEMVRKCVRHFNDGCTNVHDKAQSVRLSVVNDGWIAKVNEKIHENRWKLVLQNCSKFDLQRGGATCHIELATSSIQVRRVKFCHDKSKSNLLQTYVLSGMSTCPDSNFSLQQACHKFVMTRVQVCHKFVMTRVQACSKLTKAPKSP
ncbi:hypothetical protein AVEN_51668-1 [Araneus ventricosus]|uniref:Mos1 transposase HTH domain-containing protein n=1 Tax=Araneus ventricosus TaxID=182803 RepID=A0A4Y2UFG6_ARAVE|nr:hypothetical protein AVEN_51668-1 [Araneus ventricosus]